jgi:hypothetical protein
VKASVRQLNTSWSRVDAARAQHGQAGFIRPASRGIDRSTAGSLFAMPPAHKEAFVPKDLGVKLCIALSHLRTGDANSQLGCSGVCGAVAPCARCRRRRVYGAADKKAQCVKIVIAGDLNRHASIPLARASYRTVGASSRRVCCLLTTWETADWSPASKMSLTSNLTRFLPCHWPVTPTRWFTNGPTTSSSTRPGSMLYRSARDGIQQ